MENETQLNTKWETLMNQLNDVLGKRPADLNAVLFLIGVQELGKGPIVFTKEQKQDLMHIAVCKLFSLSGYYELEGHDSDGWPHWKNVKQLPFLNLKDQDLALKTHAIEYFEKENIF